MESFPENTSEAKSDDDDDDDTPAESARAKDQPRREREDSVYERESDKKSSEKKEKSQPEIAEEHDESVPDDELDEHEEIVVAEDLLEVRQPELGDELQAAPEGSVQEAEILGNIVLVETIKDKLSRGEAPTTESLDESVAETMQQMGIEMPDTPEDVGEENISDDLTETPEIPSGVAAGDAQEEDENQVMASTSITSPPSIPTVQPVVPSVPININVPPPPVTPPNVNTNGPPIVPPLPPYRQPYANMPPFNPYGPGPTPNVMPPPPPQTPNNNPNQAPNVTVLERRSAALPYLVVGYLLGRRKGRIKTEKKLLPVQKKLEKEVTELHESITAREEKIRSLIREQVATKPAMAEKIVERLAKRKQESLTAEIEPKIKTKEEAAKETTASEKAEKEKVINQRSEKIGRLAVTKERREPAPLRPSIEAPIHFKTPEIIKVPERPKSVEVMTHSELLVLAERIPFERSNAKKLFETGRLDEEGLRQVSRAFLRGERYERVVEANLQGLEASPLENSFERLPPNQPANPSKDASQSGTQAIRPVTSLSVNAALNNKDGTHPVSASVDSKHQKITKPINSKALPIALVTIIAILLLLFLLRP